MDDPSEVTKLLAQLGAGDEGATQKLLPIVYAELRRIAVNMMRNESPGHTLQPTAVVHEAYLRLFAESSPHAKDRSHFFALAARSMRQVLVDHARKRFALKRGGASRKAELNENLNLNLSIEQSAEVLAIHEALELLQKVDPRQAQVVEMHYFAGNTVDEIAELFGLTDRTIKRELQTARLFLKKHLAANMVVP